MTAVARQRTVTVYASFAAATIFFVPGYNLWLYRGRSQRIDLVMKHVYSSAEAELFFKLLYTSTTTTTTKVGVISDSHKISDSIPRICRNDSLK
jgi:hypothetical protein